MLQARPFEIGKAPTGGAFDKVVIFEDGIEVRRHVFTGEFIFFGLRASPIEWGFERFEPVDSERGYEKRAFEELSPKRDVSVDFRKVESNHAARCVDVDRVESGPC